MKLTTIVAVMLAASAANAAPVPLACSGVWDQKLGASAGRKTFFNQR
jgi:hypothetical protein